MLRINVQVCKDWEIVFEERPSETGVQVLAWLSRGEWPQRETYLGGNFQFSSTVRAAEFRRLEGSRAQVALELENGSFTLCLNFDNPGEAWIF